MSDGWDFEESPFHWGEQQVQERVGVRDIEQWARKVVRDHLPDQHRDFHTAMPFLVAAARDSGDRPWVTLLTGPDGFVQSPDPQTLVMNAELTPGDALESAFTEGADVGILGIELATRRRNRVNGHIKSGSSDAIVFSVDQSFGNCPQYIREREWKRVDDQPAGEPLNSDRLSPSQQKWISAADTFFIASGYRDAGPDRSFGMDASHRGGDAGFVQVVSPTRIAFPDFAGNNHFNTLGNLIADSRAGFLFIDFETGSLLQLTGRAEIDWDEAAVAHIPGARRLVTFDIEEVVELPSGVGLRWDANAESVRSLRLVEKRKESEDVTSFIFESRDGGPLASYEPGQHLPIELHVPEFEEPVRRTYSLSGSSQLNEYRITVKREPKGIASRFLHDHLEEGAIIESRLPAGEFTMSCSKCPLALVSAGVGVTPMVSMLHEVARQNGDRPTWFIHGGQDGAHHALASEVRALAEGRSNITIHNAFSRPRDEDKLGRDFDSLGRVDGALLATMVDDPDTHYFLCGPTAFMADVQSALEAADVPPGNIHSETFGPKG